MATLHPPKNLVSVGVPGVPSTASVVRLRRAEFEGSEPCILHHAQIGKYHSASLQSSLKRKLSCTDSVGTLRTARPYPHFTTVDRNQSCVRMSGGQRKLADSGAIAGGAWPRRASEARERDGGR